MNTLPKHVAFIMDGNGRWAEARNLPRALGHRAGAESVRRAVKFARLRGIQFLTLYAFSTENWSRPGEEVDNLMELMASFLASELPGLLENGIRLKVLGDRAALPESLGRRLSEAEGLTAGMTGMTLSLAINYGSRDEIIRAARRATDCLAASGRTGGQLTQDFFASFLDTAGLPDPDLIIRTAGEMRLSNFLLWQAAYAELFFSRRPWPDFGEDDFEEALREYGKRTRKFGA
ncbi:MAG: di-trans,poly-cis-decaprenylcistransferase [Planctomycetota bacterium]|jgi:undecaprenyl diphosphate synthase|nr:di-trans,poly-cis-decaprenylcistransferase [Planctomycetota bacterium]